jgi:signal peptidase I
MRTLSDKIIILLLIIVLLSLIYAIVRIFVADQFIIPTWSMSPTLVAGDRVVVNKLIMGARLYTDFDFKQNGQELKSIRMKGLRGLRHNDIVVFNYPQVGGRIAFKINYVYCKRCVALPGDTLNIVNGIYKNNNYDDTLGLHTVQLRLAAVDETQYSTEARAVYPFDARVGWTFKNMGPLYIPRKGDIMTLTPKEGAVYKGLLEFETGKRVTVNWNKDLVLLDGKPTNRYEWTNNYYFMAGDNVFDSMDSRYWGLVPEDYIVGVVQMISYSKDKETDTIKWERTFLER